MKDCPVTSLEFCPVVSPTESTIRLVAFETDHESLVTVPGLIDVGEAVKDEMLG